MAREPVTSGSVNVYKVRFTFSPEWEGLERTAVFRAGEVSRSAALDESGTCAIPWEVLCKPHVSLYAGVCGSCGAQTVLPTVWACLGTVLEGALPCALGQPAPTVALDHYALEHREAADQHPLGAITGLEQAIRRIPAPVEALSNLELEELLK